MCLSYVDKETIVVKEAYKVFEKKKDNKLVGLFWDFPFIRRRWLSDTKVRSLGEDLDKPYTTGFHCFVDKNFALSYTSKVFNKDLMQPVEVCHRVLVKEIVASGYQSRDPESKTVVARQIYIMEEVK